MSRLHPSTHSGPPETCEWCQDAPAEHEHHVARGSSRQISDPYPELKLNLCQECHEDLHEQKAERAIGLALLVLLGKASIGRVLDLFYKVTARANFPEERKVRKWMKRLRAEAKPTWRE